MKATLQDRGRLLGLLVLLTAAGCAEPGQERNDAAAGAAAVADARQEADLILTNAAIYTLDPAQPWAEALAIGAGRILAVGGAGQIAAAYRGETLDLAGQMVLPGFHDGHSHPVSGGVQMLQCDLSAAASVAETLNRIAACHAATPVDDDPASAWLVGGGWDLGLFADANPHKQLLDAIVGDRPVYLRGADGHSGWASSAALARAGISADTANPPLGVIERDAAGEPTGTLRETAMGLVGAVLPEVTEEQRVAGALAALEMANAFGITSLVAASVDAEELAVWRRLEREGRMTVRVVASISMNEGADSGANSRLLAPESRGSEQLVRADAAKIFLDGVLEGETAALLEPYLDPQGKGGGRMGDLHVPWEELRATVVALDARGVQVHMHAIGDAAVRQGLDAIAAAREVNGAGDNRHHICHLQLVHPDDYPRFGELGVLANFQALWAYPDEYITDINLPAVGAERVQRMYPIRSIEQAGGTIVGGSDWSVSSMNPLDAIEVAVTRQDPAGLVSGVLNAAEAVTLETMLAAYTRGTAFLMHQEDRSGMLAAGMLADLVVLDRNLFDLAPSAINEARVVKTYFSGRLVYSAQGQMLVDQGIVD
ncbi:MAG: amidohydrolase [Pseudomonadales bacterium]